MTPINHEKSNLPAAGTLDLGRCQPWGSHWFGNMGSLKIYIYIKYICASLNGWVSHWNQDKQRQHSACTLHALQILCPLLCQANSSNEVLVQLYSSYREPESFFQSAGNFQLTVVTSFCHRFVRQKKLHHLAFSAPAVKISLCNKKSIRFFYSIRYRNMPFSCLCLWFILWSISLVKWHLMLHEKGKKIQSLT